MDHIRVSIVTVVYNGASSIAQTINSVIGQDYPNIEYIVIDNCSTDGTLDIIKGFGSKLRLISEPDNGIYDAMNKGIALATGDLIGIINSDDWYEPNAVSIMVAHAKQNQDCSIFHGLLRFVDKNGLCQSIMGHHNSFLAKGMIEHPTCFVRSEVYQNLLYNTNYQIAADYDFMLNVKHKGYRFYFIDSVIANFRDGGKSNSFLGAKETLAIQQKHKLIGKFKSMILTTYFWLRRRK